MHRIYTVLIPCCLLSWAATARAGTVAIVRERHPTPALTEAVSRLHGELLSVGLEVTLLDRPVSRRKRAESLPWLKKAAAESDLDAVIEVIGDEAPVEVDVWVVENQSRHWELTRVALEPDASNIAERLAIMAVEVLRSTFLEKEMVTSNRHPASSPAKTTVLPSTHTERKATAGKSTFTQVPRLERAESAKQLGRFSVEAGAALLTNLGGVGSAFLPLARITWAPLPWLGLQLVGAGLGTSPTLETSAGRARTTQQFATLGASYRVRPDRWLWPFVSVACGILHTSLEGQADSPLLGHALDQWSFLMEARLGAGLRFLERYYLTLSMHAQMAEPYVAVRFANREVATTGHPNLLLSLTIGTWL